MSIQLENHGSVVLIRPLDEETEEWLREHTDGMWWGGALVVEPRYVEELLQAIEEGS